MTTVDSDETIVDSDDVRVIETGALPERFARGWHCLGLVEQFRDGVPHSVQAFGTKLVVFANSHGDIKVLDAYCRHMGGDLSKGTVKGDSVACPFHDWRWGGNGKCTAIPYARRVPPLARTRSWTTLERNGQVFVWHDPQRSTPPADVTIPAIEGFGDPQWSDWAWNAVLIEGTNCRELVDNVVDMAHFYYVHFNVPRSFKNVFDGHVASQFMTFTPRSDMGDQEFVDFGEGSVTRSDASYYGPSYMIDNLTADTPDGPIETVLINCHYPITGDSFMLQYGVMVKKLPGMSDEQAEAMAQQFGSANLASFEQDIKIWRTKAKVDNPLLCEEDGPVYQLRRWYEQFYVDVEDITDDMIRRFEFEIDTTRSGQHWDEEMVANRAAAATADRQSNAGIR